MLGAEAAALPVLRGPGCGPQVPHESPRPRRGVLKPSRERVGMELGGWAALEQEQDVELEREEEGCLARLRPRHRAARVPSRLSRRSPAGGAGGGGSGGDDPGWGWGLDLGYISRKRAERMSGKGALRRG